MKDTFLDYNDSTQGYTGPLPTDDGDGETSTRENNWFVAAFARAAPTTSSRDNDTKTLLGLCNDGDHHDYN